MNAIAAKVMPQEVADSIEWLRVDRCPACETPHGETVQMLDSGYMFGDERIAFPQGGISIASCSACSLVYKTVLPAPLSLAQVLERQAGKKWMEPYDFRAEVLEMLHFAGKDSALLDIGSGCGALLAAWAHRGATGRRSALDVVQHPGCSDHVNDEFIHGLIDSRPLRWNGEPYDLVTMFDVLEHLYAPQLAFEHLRELVRDNGLVVIETGNVDSEWPSQYGAHNWWYVRLFEHHVFWSRRAVEALAKRFGFRLLIWREQRHKARVSLPLTRIARDLAQVGLYRLAPRTYPNIAPLLGKYWTQPWSPFTTDHFRVVMRKL